MRKLVQTVVRGFLTIVTVLAIYLGAAVVGAIIPGQVSATAQPDGQEVEIILISSAIHYDFLIPATDEARAVFGFARDAGVPLDAPWVEWILIGWGAREFYTTTGEYSDIATGAVLRGLTGDRSVLRIEVAGAVPDGLDLPRLRLTAGQMSGLLGAMRASFQTDDAGAAIALATTGFTWSDRFFEAKGRFHIFRTCNTWVTRMLREAGVPSGIWTPTPYAVTLSLWWFGSTS
jgi:uncharacterized protein (TIGR02117 family)